MDQNFTLPKVSVVIPTYNRAKELLRGLDSLVEQSFKNFEVLVCDNGSTDETTQVVQLYSKQLRIQHHWSKNSGGPALPRNLGWRLAKAEYIAFLDSDDWWHPKKLEESVIRLDSGADLIYHDLYLVKSKIKRLNWRRLNPIQLSTPVFQNLLMYGNVIPNSSVVIRKSLLEKVGGQTEEKTMISGEDYDCWLRVAMHTERFERLDETLGYYWVGGGNITSPERTIKLLDEFRDRYFRDRFDCMPDWYHNRMGKAYFHLSCYDKAIPHLQNAFSRNTSLIDKLIIILMLVVIFFRFQIKTK